MSQDCFRHHIRLEHDDSAGRGECVRSNFLRFSDCVNRFLREQDGRAAGACRICFFLGDTLGSDLYKGRCSRISGLVTVADRCRNGGVLASVICVAFRYNGRCLSNEDHSFCFFQLSGQLRGDGDLLRYANDLRRLERRRLSYARGLTCVVRSIRRQAFGRVSYFVVR